MRPLVSRGAVLAVDQHFGRGVRVADVGRVDEDPLAPAFQRQHEFAHRLIRDRLEVAADPAIDRVDPADDVDVDQPVHRQHQVGQRVVGAAQVDRAFDRVVQQRRPCFREAVDRAGRAFVGGELEPGADRPDVPLIEEDRVRQRHRDPFHVRVTFTRGQAVNDF